MLQTIQITVVSHPTAFLRIIGLYSRRNITIESMTIDRSELSDLYDVKITAHCDSATTDSLVMQLSKQVDVINVYKYQNI